MQSLMELARPGYRQDVISGNIIGYVLTGKSTQWDVIVLSISYVSSTFF